MSSFLRPCLAVAICLTSAGVGTIAILRGWGSVSTVAINVACPWFLSGSWLAGELSHEGWKRLNKSMAAIHEEAKQGKLPKTPPLARVMRGGGAIMLLAGIMAFFV